MTFDDEMAEALRLDAAKIRVLGGDPGVPVEWTEGVNLLDEVRGFGFVAEDDAVCSYCGTPDRIGCHCEDLRDEQDEWPDRTLAEDDGDDAYERGRDR